MNISIRLFTEVDLSALLKIGIGTYRDSFGSMNEPETMNAYLAEAFTATKFASKMVCPGTRFYFLEVEGKLAGYLKLNLDSAQSDIRDPQALEIERIYVRKEIEGSLAHMHMSADPKLKLSAHGEAAPGVAIEFGIVAKRNSLIEEAGPPLRAVLFPKIKWIH